MVYSMQTMFRYIHLLDYDRRMTILVHVFILAIDGHSRGGRTLLVIGLGETPLVTLVLRVGPELIFRMM